MNRPEVATLLGLCAAYDSRTVGEADVEAWHLLMSHVGFSDAKEAVQNHYATESQRIMPADVLKGVRGLRKALVDRADASFVFVGDPDDTAEYSRQLLEHRTAVGDGLRDPAPEHPVAPIANPVDTLREINRRRGVMALESGTAKQDSREIKTGPTRFGDLAARYPAPVDPPPPPPGAVQPAYCVQCENVGMHAPDCAYAS